MKKVALFSDLHAGDGSAADMFGIKDGKLVLDTINEFISKEYDVVLIGDILEGFKFTFHSILKAYPDLLPILKHPNVKIVLGNHDKEILKQWGRENDIPIYGELTLFGGQVFIYHGHIDDRPKIDKKLVKVALKVFAFIENVLGHKIADWLQVEPVSPNDPHYKGDRSEYIKLAKQRGEEGNYKIVCIGHTHEPFFKDYGNVTVIDTGTCQLRKLMYATIIQDDNGVLNANLTVHA